MAVSLLKFTKAAPRLRAGEIRRPRPCDVTERVNYTYYNPVPDTYHLRPSGNTLRVQMAASNASAYVWGRQDAGDGEFNTTTATAFSDAYAEHVRRFVAEEHHAHTNLQRAYELWITGQEIAA